MRETEALAAIVANAALYTVVGTLTYFGISFHGVRFWPAVVVPATFSVLYGPMVGGVGAAIGIFVSDLLIHGIPLLSLSVGVPANFIGFYIVGLARRRFSWPRYFLMACLGLAAGSAIIGVGIWAWSQYFILPFHTEHTPLPLAAAATTALWTFISEIPFLILVVPPLAKACFAAFPKLRPPARWVEA